MRPLVFADLGAARCSGMAGAEQSNYWSVTGEAARFDTKSYALTHADIHTGQQSHLSLQSHTWKHLFWLTYLMSACENVGFPALTPWKPEHGKQKARRKQLGLCVFSVCWGLAFCHTPMLSQSHSHMQHFLLQCMAYHSVRPPTHTRGWCSEVSESSGW